MTDDRQLKTQFAMALLKCPGDPHQAAFAVMPDNDPGAAMEAAKRWPLDSFVISEMERLKDEGFTVDNPDKDAQAFEIWKMATDDKLSAEDRLKAHELYAKIKGHIERPTVNNGIINNSNKVMVVRVSAETEEEWEQQATMSQRLLQGN